MSLQAGGVADGALDVAPQQGLAHHAAQAAGGGDDALFVALEQLPVEPGLVEVPLEEGGRRQLDEVLVAGGGLGQQGEVVVELLAPLALAAAVVDPAPAHGALEAALAGHVGLDAEHGRDAGLAGGPVEVEDAVHVAVVGDADGGLAVGHGRGHDLVDPCGPVEHRELGVDVEMGEALPHQATPLRITLWNDWGNKLQPCNLALVATACEVSPRDGGRHRVRRHPSARLRGGARSLVGPGRRRRKWRLPCGLSGKRSGGLSSRRALAFKPLDRCHAEVAGEGRDARG